VAPNICGFWWWNWLHISHLVSRILGCLLCVCKFLQSCRDTIKVYNEPENCQDSCCVTVHIVFRRCKRSARRGVPEHRASGHSSPNSWVMAIFESWGSRKPHFNFNSYLTEKQRFSIKKINSWMLYREQSLFFLDACGT
jgi:hypothetical protein